MPKTTYRVETPHGTITRTTNRTYAYVVVARAYRKDLILAQHQFTIVQLPKDRAYILGKLAEIEAGQVDGYTTAGQRREQLAQVDAQIAGTDDALAADLAKSDAALTAPFDGKSGAWSSRLDLARKEAARLADHYRDVRIFDVATGAEVAR